MRKIKKDYTKLSVKNLPVRKKRKKAAAAKKYDLISRKSAVHPVSFRMRPEIFAMLKEITEDIRLESQLRITNTAALELIIMYAKKVDIKHLMNP